MNVLVTGGAGYIGSFMVKRLLERGDDVIVVDSLERGHKDAVDLRAKFYQGDLLDKNFVEKVFSENKIDCVMHFAAYISVGESMQKPGMYFHNNVISTIQLLDLMHEHNVKNFVFSSTGTIYGVPEQLPTPENHPKNPENSYAQSKLMVEQILHWYYKVYDIGYVVLRYFNAAGGALDGSNGEKHDPETHLIPNAIQAAISNKEFSLFGNDYKTSDGSAIRDYIHVLDLVDAHILTLQALRDKNSEYIYNVGTGKGSTNMEVVAMIKKISGVDFPVKFQERREGDVAETVADISKIKSELSFTPKYSDLETIIKTAWKWHNK